jgi:transcriptional regulator with XRE-family HTH domain
MPAKTEYDNALLAAHFLHEGLYRRVADRLGIDPSYVSRVARGKRDAADILSAIMDELHKIQRPLK